MLNQIENTINAWKKARIQGELLLQLQQITWTDFCDCMRLYEESLKEAGVSL